MKKLNKVAVLFASAAIAAPFAAFAQSNGADNWRSTDGTVWKNGTNELCWRDANWTPATANQACDGALKPAAAPAPAPAPRVAPPAARPAPAPAPAPAPRPAPAAPKPVSEKVTFAADAFFDFDKSVLKPEGKKSIDDAIAKMKSIDVEIVIATGHTDSIGTDAYNQKLSERRATSVKEYMVSKGVPAAKVTTLGKGETQPVATNKTKEGRAKNRRVDIEFKGVSNK